MSGEQWTGGERRASARMLAEANQRLIRDSRSIASSYALLSDERGQMAGYLESLADALEALLTELGERTSPSPQQETE